MGKVFCFAGACALLVACQPSITMSTQQMDAIHRDCTVRINQGYVVSQRPEDIGRMSPRKARGTPVVIYGADWCEACEIAKRYMTRQGIPYVEHDIEEDSGAKSAMDATLVRAGLPVSLTLPVIDVRGTVTKGFMPCVVDAVWGET